MEAIIDCEKQFKFNDLYFKSPSSANGGNYFIKIMNGTTPLYLQSPKCILKNGIVKTGKRLYSDLMFNRDDAKFIEWIENLENICRAKIFENREKWFDSDLLEDDIESSFAPPFKLFKSGSYYILRASIPTLLDKPNIKIYNEDGNEIKISDVKKDESVVTILEIQGIKCSARSFQLEFIVKQLLSINPVDIFDKLLLTNKNNNIKYHNEPNKDYDVKEPDKDYDVKEPDIDDDVKEPDIDDDVKEPDKDDVKEPDKDDVKEPDKDDDDNLVENEVIKISNVNTDASFTIDTIDDPKSKVGTQHLDFRKDDNDLVEIDIQPSDTDTFFLKKRNDVYYNMYREALKKAKTAKEIALTNYLEAKRIKNTYMLTDLNDDSDADDSDMDDSDMDDIV
jgi:hypothetical protein